VNCETLAEVLQAAGKPAKTLCFPDGSRLLILPHGDLEEYFQPRQLDPGNNTSTRSNNRIQLSKRHQLRMSRSEVEVDLKIAKTIRAAPNPVRAEPGFETGGRLEYAGYTLETSLEVIESWPALPPAIGIWNLVQLLHGGGLLIPTYGRHAPKTWFGQVPREDLEIRANSIRYLTRASGGQKIGLRATATPGTAGYIYRTGREHALVIRNCFVNPSGEYADAPWWDHTLREYSIQACNVASDCGNFSELEYQAPAIGRVSGESCYQDVSQVWAFRGESGKVRAATNVLLGC